MKFNKPLLSFVLFAGVIFYFSCRRERHEIISDNFVESKFFTVPAATHPLIIAISKKIFWQNEQYHFVKELVNRVGYPYWDKAIIASARNKTGVQAKSTGEDASTMIYIPFVNEEKGIIDASLIVKTDETDTLFRLLNDYEYSNFGFEDDSDSLWKAKDVFNLFSAFDDVIFNHPRIHIKDNRLLTDFPNLSIDTNHRYILQKSDTAFNERLSSGTPFFLTQCFQVGDEGDRGQLVGIPPGGNPNYSTVGIICINTIIWIDLSNGNGLPPIFPFPTNEGGGGSGGNAPWWPAPCYNGPQSLMPCPTNGPGWEPVTYQTPSSEPIDSLLAKYSRLTNKYSDSLMILSNQDTAEYFFAIIDFNNNQLDTMYMHTDGSGVEVNPNWGVYGGRRLLGGWHSHFNNEDGSSGSGPTGADVAQLWRVKNIQDFILFIECSNKRFALVIENPQKLNQWFTTTGNGPVVLANRFNTMVNSDSRVWTSEFQNLTIEKLLGILGNSSVCGIGIYQSSNSERTTFTKLN